MVIGKVPNMPHQYQPMVTPSAPVTTKLPIGNTGGNFVHVTPAPHVPDTAPMNTAWRQVETPPESGVFTPAGGGGFWVKQTAAGVGPAHSPLLDNGLQPGSGLADPASHAPATGLLNEGLAAPNSGGATGLLNEGPSTLGTGGATSLLNEGGLSSADLSSNGVSTVQGGGVAGEPEVWRSSTITVTQTHEAGTTPPNAAEFDAALHRLQMSGDLSPESAAKVTGAGATVSYQSEVSVHPGQQADGGGATEVQSLSPASELSPSPLNVEGTLSRTEDMPHSPLNVESTLSRTEDMPHSPLNVESTLSRTEDMPHSPLNVESTLSRTEDMPHRPLTVETGTQTGHGDGAVDTLVRTEEMPYRPLALDGDGMSGNGDAGANGLYPQLEPTGTASGATTDMEARVPYGWNVNPAEPGAGPENLTASEQLQAQMAASTDSSHSKLMTALKVGAGVAGTIVVGDAIYHITGGDDSSDGHDNGDVTPINDPLVPTDLDDPSIGTGHGSDFALDA
jgi:hypothetical protein